VAEFAVFYAHRVLASKNQIRCNIAIKAKLFLNINEQKHHIVKIFCRKFEMYKLMKYSLHQVG
jgi:hypothetical protein